MQYIIDQAMADQIYQRIATKIHFDRTFPEGVLKQDVPNKIWINFWSLQGLPFFTILGRITKLVVEQQYIIALHPRELESFQAAHGAFPIATVEPEETLQDIGQPPKGSKSSLGILVGTPIFYIFNKSLDWLIYCDRDYELCMLCCFNQRLYPAVEREVRAVLLRDYDEDEPLITMEEFFEPSEYSGLSAAQIAALIALYDTKPES